MDCKYSWLWYEDIPTKIAVKKIIKKVKWSCCFLNPVKIVDENIRQSKANKPYKGIPKIFADGKKIPKNRKLHIKNGFKILIKRNLF